MDEDLRYISNKIWNRLEDIGYDKWKLSEIWDVTAEQAAHILRHPEEWTVGMLVRLTQITGLRIRMDLMDAIYEDICQ